MSAGDDTGDVAPPADENADLPVDYPGQCGQLSGQIVGDDSFRRNAAAVEMLQPPELFRFQACGVAMNLVDRIFCSISGLGIIDDLLRSQYWPVFVIPAFLCHSRESGNPVI